MIQLTVGYVAGFIATGMFIGMLIYSLKKTALLFFESWMLTIESSPIMEPKHHNIHFIGLTWRYKLRCNMVSVV